LRVLLGTEKLKSGETLAVECLQAPDSTELADAIRPFLGHKERYYGSHIKLALTDRCDGLETRWYVGLIDGKIVGNIQTIESCGAGILGHVFTRPEHRRKGVAHAIMGLQMEEFRARQGKVLLLATGFQGAPYWLYHGFGFRDLAHAKPGKMRYAAPGAEDFEQRFLSEAAAAIVPAGWRHWPLTGLLASVPGTGYLRSLTLNIWGACLPEGDYCSYMFTYGQNPGARSVVLESAAGAVLAMATLVPDSRWKGDVRILDVFGHPSLDADDLCRVVSSLPVAEARTQCYADPNDAPKLAALEQAGFRRTAILPEQFQEGGIRRDAWCFTHDS
jgi:GNAT superfamily N-acetyltransferase